jgi:hypothetical protein
MRVFSLAALVLLPALSLAQDEQPPTDAAEPAAEAIPEVPSEGPSEGREGKRWGRHHRKHDGHGPSARGWHSHHHGQGWRMAVEAGTGLGLGLSAQVSVRPRRGPFAIGVGAVGFGERRLGWGQDQDQDQDTRGDDGRRRNRLQVAARQGYFVSLQRYRSHGRSGLYAGLKLGVADAAFRRGADDPARMWALFAAPELGVQWFPFRRSFFIRPSVGANLFAGRWAADFQAPRPPFLTGWGALTVGLAR